MEDMLLDEMTWDEVKACLRTHPETVAAIPLGSTEQHGKHLPIATDTITARRMTQIAAEIATKKGASILVCPTLPFGATSMSMDFPGTISLRTSTLEACLLDICDSLIHHGIKRIALVEGEGGNYPAVSSVLRHYEDTRGPDGPLVVSVKWWAPSFSADLIRKHNTSQFGHASEIETSLMLALGERVLMNKATKSRVGPWFPFVSHDYAGEWRPTIESGYPRLSRLSKTGATGDSTRGSKRRGERFLDDVTKRIGDVLYELHKLRLR